MEASTETEGAEAPALEIDFGDPSMGFAALLWSDYEVGLLDRDEPPWLSKLLLLPRLLLNPSFQLCFLVRLAQKGPRPLLWPIRWLQVVLFSCEIHEFRGEHAIRMGPAICFPHPFNIIIGGGVQIGSGVTVYNSTNIGAARHLVRGTAPRAVPRLGDRSVIYAFTAIQGGYDIGQDAVVGIHIVLDHDVPPGALQTKNQLRLAGEWAGEERSHWYPPKRR